MIDGDPCHDINTAILKRYRSPHNIDVDKTVHKTFVVHINNLNHFKHELFARKVLQPNNVVEDKGAHAHESAAKAATSGTRNIKGPLAGVIF
jgi:hypothetical protein